METKYLYIAPQVERIELDNEISLALESNPPFGPGEFANSSSPNLLNNDPFKLDIG